MSNIVLVVVAHADDEVLGCGGTIARHVSQGDYVHLVIMTNGVGSRSDAVLLDIQSRAAASENAAKILGISSLKTLNFPDNALDTVSLLEIAKELESLVKSLRPKIVYTHHYGDLNIDHRRTQEAVMIACRPHPG